MDLSWLVQRSAYCMTSYAELTRWKKSAVYSW